MGEKARLDSIIRIQSCYIVDKYISLDQKTYNPAVPHKACLKLGKRATFVPVFNDQIPDHYYNFATFDELKDRATPPKMLTDYIGRVEDTDNPTTRAGTRLKKVIIQDTRENTFEMTFWPDQSSTLPDHVKKGDILAITSAAVTNFEGNYQLESTPATTVTVNPTTADTANYITRLKNLPTKALAQLDKNIVTITQLNAEKNKDRKTRGRFTCLAKIKAIPDNRAWFYAPCPNPKCTKKLHLLTEPTTKFVCEDDDNIEQPKVMYCVNAIITDDIQDASVVFFDEAMTTLLNITCEEMITVHKYHDKREIPDKMYSVINTQKLMNVTIKPDRTIAVNSVAQPPITALPQPATTPTTALPPTATSAPSLLPATPAAKINPAKRPYHQLKDKKA
ncbi:putative nucleic acid-binding, replication factor A [Helianthus anomalus]